MLDNGTSKALDEIEISYSGPDKRNVRRVQEDSPENATLSYEFAVEFRLQSTSLCYFARRSRDLYDSMFRF